MTAYVIDGKAIAAKVRSDVAADVAMLKSQHGFVPGLAVVLVGEDPASKVYVRNKAAQTVECGMQSFEHKLAEDTPEQVVLDLVAKLNADPNVNGILVQMPLPKHMDSNKVLELIDPAEGRRRLPPDERRAACRSVSAPWRRARRSAPSFLQSR